MLIQSHIMIMVWDSYGFFSKEYVGAIAGYASASSETSIDGTPYGSVDPDEYEYYEKYDMYLYTTSDDLQFCYMPSLQRIDVQKTYEYFPKKNSHMLK